MAITGPWFITRAALEDFGRLTGREGRLPNRRELEAVIATAHFVKVQNDGTEVWRGGKPLRLRFIVRTGAGVGGDAPQLVRVEGASAERAPRRARRIRVWSNGQHVELDVTGEVTDPGPERRVAYRLANGYWCHGVRGRSRPDEVLDLTAPLAAPPEWTRALLGQRSRRGRDR